MAHDQDLWIFFFCLAQVYFWYPLNIITGGTTAKIMLAAKDNFLGKYIYKDTLARNLAAVIYKVIDDQQQLFFGFIIVPTFLTAIQFYY
jgi:hypothetical protein